MIDIPYEIRLAKIAVKLGLVNTYFVEEALLAINADPLAYVNCDKFPLLGHYAEYLVGGTTPPIQYGTMTDPRDGHVYKTITVGQQTWMAENLAYECDGSYAYDDDESNVETCGRLYTWDVAMNAAPPGWHLPTREEWQQLADYLGGNKISGKFLKAESFGGLDIGFCALPAGYRIRDDDFINLGGGADFWSASEYFSDGAFDRYLYYYDEVFREGWDSKKSAFSVRLVRDFR